jgi:nitroreductase
MRCGQDPIPIDVAIAIDHMTLAAAAEGLGTCWIGSFYPEKVREILGIPEEIVIVELLPLGYPSDPGKVEKSRLSLDEIVKYEKW